jgi:predicted phosphodiesterase
VRYLIISDLHSNLEALEAVVESATGEFDLVLCCGDLVGYGADPGPVLEWVRSHAAAVVRGNHDRACAGSDDIEWFSPPAREAALWTLTVLTAEQLLYLRNLPCGPLAVDQFQIMHGSPLDEDEYLITPSEAAHQLSAIDRWVSFFGHTHIQGGFRCHRFGSRAIPGPSLSETERVVELQEGDTYLINPGSVGQPRDGDWRAAYCIFSPEDRLVTYRRVRYEVTSAQRKIRNAGLPDLLAERISRGR